MTLLKGDYTRMLTWNFLLDLLCLKTSYWFIAFVVYNYILFYICHRFTFLQKYKYPIFIAFGAYFFFFTGGLQRSEQCLSFVTGMWMAENLETAKRILLNKWGVLTLLATSVVFIAIQQMPSVNEILEGNQSLFRATNVLVKYPFALFVTAIFAPPHTQNAYYQCITKIRHKLEGSVFIAFCSRASLELYLVHVSLRFIIDKDNQLTTIIIFLVLTFILSYIYNRINGQISKWMK